ncbi:MAG: hypothetical protein H8D22_12460 [Candidatus Cloacimonetes bacterium]|nr:hypothetical protein [Candidatus Cloacimonadota bacterium]
MHSNRKKMILILAAVLIVGFGSYAFGKSVMGGSGGNKRLDIFHYHNVGNIWLRVSNYGFFGSGDDVVPQWPSLEYPGGSGIDYLYQGALWFGAKKQKRNVLGEELYWQDEGHENEGTTDMGYGSVIDTLVSVGFDGDADMYEFLPAYNQLEENALGALYDKFNLSDGVLSASIREQRLGVDDDGDGKVDEDPAGFAFPYRPTVPSEFKTFYPGDNYWRGTVDSTQCDPGEIQENISIWFPLGFLKLGYIDPDSIYNFAQIQDDDGDGLKDEDGYPMSEQDYLGYYYDYSPFDTPGARIWGGWTFNQGHTPINVRVRQVSFQWSYDYIKNLCYVEFDITNMNPSDILYDCAMGIYMDCDVGPQSWGGDPRSMDDISSYVAEGLEFAYTYDADKDAGLTTGFIGARVCTPDPEELEFACWFWNRGQGPHDEDPNTQDGRNQKYWLMTNRNPDENKFISLRDQPDAQLNDPDDTRFLFAFYGDMQGYDNPTDASWNLVPYETMKIVIAVFPGESVPELKRTADWAKEIYGTAQGLTEVILPDTCKHYEAPGPPEIPKMTLTQSDNGDSIFIYWDNCSEFSIDEKIVSKVLINSGFISDSAAYRVKHDFQGYSLWKASNSGEQDAYMRVGRWDKIDTKQDLEDYSCLLKPTVPEDYKVYLGGYLGIDIGLPNSHLVKVNDTVYDTVKWIDYFKLDSLYQFSPVMTGEIVYGKPLYNILDSSDVVFEQGDCDFKTEEELLEEARLFKNPNISNEIYDKLYSDRLIPLPCHLGQSHPQGLEELRKDRLSRRYYEYIILYPEKGVENYIAVTAYDRGIPDKDLESLESGRDGNRITIFPGPAANPDLFSSPYVVPNPYLGQSKFDGRRDKDEEGDRSKRIWFVNLPEHCTIKIFTLAGDLVDEIEHNGAYVEDVINPSKATHTGITSSGIHAWDMLSRHDQIIASGVYLYSVKDHNTGNVKVDKFVLIK